MLGLGKVFKRKQENEKQPRSAWTEERRFITGLSHVNVGVPDLERAIDFYQSFLGAEPRRVFPNFKNRGFAQSAGFIEAPENVEVSIAFLDIPGSGLTLELMEYHLPVNRNRIDAYSPNDVAGVRHVALRVNDIERAFENAKSESGVRMISANSTYMPFTISKTEPKEFRFFDEKDEDNAKLKAKTARVVSQIRYFYCVDPYGVQWEFEYGNDGVGS